MTAAIYPCDSCGLLRTKEQGGTVFTVCDDCWDWTHGGTATYDARTSALAANLSAAALEELRVQAAVARCDSFLARTAGMVRRERP